MSLLTTLSVELTAFLNGKRPGSPIAPRDQGTKILLGDRLNDLANLGLATAAKGASLIGLYDVGDYFAATDVEAGLAEVGAAYFGEEEVFVAVGAMTAAEVKLMNGTPIEMIGIPAAGLYIEVIDCHWQLVHAGVDYDAAGAGEDLQQTYTDENGAQLTTVVDHSGFADASADAHKFCPAIQNVPLRAAVVASILVGSWFGAAGDGSLAYKTRYRIRTLDLSA